MMNEYVFQFPLGSWEEHWTEPAEREVWAERARTDPRAKRVVELMAEQLALVQSWGSKTSEGFRGGLTAWVDPDNEEGTKPLLVRIKVSRLD
jgi:hypothetical protein